MTSASSLLSGVADAGTSESAASDGASATDVGADATVIGAATGDSTTASAAGGEGSGNATSDTNAESNVASTVVDYTDFTVPDGVSLNPELLGEYKGIAKELGIAQDGAQKLVDLGVKLSAQVLANQQAVKQAEIASWADAAKTDKEFGGDKLAENLSVAKKALDAFASDGLKAYLEQSGLGNHPELIRAFFKAGKLISEDRLVSGGVKPTGVGLSDAQRLYGGRHG